jgi:putative cardiolipin synthase
LSRTETYAITGGRNLGDEYFDAHAEVSFRDIDVLSTGPIAEDISKSFDEFWESSHAYPIRKLYSRLTGKLYIPYLRRKLKKNWDEQLKENPDAGQDLSRYLSGKKLIHAKAEYISDKPAKMQEHAEDSVQGPMIAIADLVEDAKNEFIMVTPYFVPREGGMAWLKQQCVRGLNIEILTNSLASTDVVAVHTGYSHHRIEILKNRIKLYELKRIDGKRTRQRPFGKSAPSYASLHAKIFIIDRRYAVIGSLNFDPRSAHLNTESAVVIDSPALAMQLYKMYQEAISPKTSYKLMLESNGGKEKLIWIAEEDGQTLRLVTEPKASPWRILQAFLISLLPVEDQL